MQFHVTYHKIKSPLLTTYKLNYSYLDRVERIKDLGIIYLGMIFVPSLTFSDHLDYKLANANMVLGLIMRFSKEFLIR